ncbi:hypothetical protein WUBG_00781 [Wuchereria bancrofti]|uniref:Uncharacterized protein n=1 Tax=Wuchereria bancrofti TaxID=6293 RepID=J9FLP0_WUCBA|nr:hypothetical protein WUBG_00781 [Wuchereria bancrofti]
MPLKINIIPECGSQCENVVARNSGPDIDSFPSYSNQVKRTNQPVKQYLSKLAFYLIKTFRKECGPLNKTGIPRNPSPFSRRPQLPQYFLRKISTHIMNQCHRKTRQKLHSTRIKLQRSNQITVNMRTNFILRKTFSGKQY